MRFLSWARRPLSEANRGWTLAAVALLVGLMLRLWSIGQARFSGEESWFWSVGRDIATGQSFPVLGHPISGTAARHPGSGFFWFLGLTQLGGASPLRAYAVFSLGGLAAIVPLSLAVARAFDRATGLALFVLAAVSPWWIVYTNSAWPGYLLPTLCALLLTWLPSLAATGPAPSTPGSADARLPESATGAANEPAGRTSPISRALTRAHSALSSRGFAQGALAFLLVIGFQVHLSLLHYWLITLVTVALWRPRVTRPLLIGLALGMLCYLPYLVHELQNGFSNTVAIAQRSQGNPRSLYVLQGLLLYFLGFTTTDVSYLWNQGFWFTFDLARFWRGSGIQQTQLFFARTGWAPLCWTMLVASWLFTLASWVVFGRALWRRLRSDAHARDARRDARRDPQNILAVAFLTAVLAIPLLYLLSGKGGYPHYVSTVLPLAFLPPAFLLGRLLRHSTWRWAALGYLALFAVAGSLGLRGYYAVDSRWSVPQTTAAVEFILKRTRTPSGQYAPFRLQYAFSPNWRSSYQLTARHLFDAPFLAGDSGELFRVEARLPGQPVVADPDTLVLPTLVVRHHKSAK